MNNEDNATTLRVDKWLWAARFYKSRVLATEAVNGGHVHINGEDTKPGRGVQVGDELRIRKAESETTVIVRGLSRQRGPAVQARQLYEETEVSRVAREAAAEQRRGNPAPASRPNKRERRHIMRFTDVPE